MLSAVILSERGYPAVPLVGQLVDQRFVRPGPLVLGTGFLKLLTRAADRDRTVSRMYLPHYCGHRLYLHPISGGRRVMGLIDLPCGRRPISSIEQNRGSRYGDQPTLATRMLFDIRNGKTVSYLE